MHYRLLFLGFPEVGKSSFLQKISGIDTGSHYTKSNYIELRNLEIYLMGKVVSVDIVAVPGQDFLEQKILYKSGYPVAFLEAKPLKEFEKSYKMCMEIIKREFKEIPYVIINKIDLYERDVLKKIENFLRKKDVKFSMISVKEFPREKLIDVIRDIIIYLERKSR